MRRRKAAQEYSPEEFDAVVDLLKNDPKMRRNLEAVTGKSLRGKSNREIFDLYLTVGKAAEVAATFAAFGKARVVLDETRREIEGQEAVSDALDTAHSTIKDLEQTVQELRRALKSEQTAHLNAIAAPAMAVYAEGTPQ